MQRRAGGFSLLELLIVVAIMLVIAAVAIPSYMSAMQRAREASAVGYLRALVAAQENYRTTHGQYADSFAQLGPYLGAELVLPENPGWPCEGIAFAAPPKDKPSGKGGKPGKGRKSPDEVGTPSTPESPPATPDWTPPPTDSIVYSMYIVQLTLPSAEEWQCTAEPLRDRTANKFFYTDNSGVIRYALGSLADAASPPI